MKTFTNCAEKKAKQFLNLLQGYTKGIRFTAILILLLMGVSNAWAEQNLYEVWMQYTFNGNSNSYTYYKSDNNSSQSLDLGTLTSDFIITDCYWKCYADWKPTTTVGYLWYQLNTGNGVTKSKSVSNAGNGSYEIGGSSLGWKVASKIDPSGKYTMKHNFYAYFNYSGGHNDWTMNNSGNNYKYTYTVLPPSVKGFTVTPSGNKLSGSGTQNDPYIIKYNGSLTLTLSGSQNHTDANSTIQYNTAGTWNTTNSRTISNITSTAVKNVTVKARYKHKSEDLSGTESSQTIYYRSEQVYTVTFNENGHGTAPAAQTVSQGSKATQPTAPTATGYTFGGWYKESNCTNAFDFNTAINADITLFAKWTISQYALTYSAGEGGSVTGTHESGAKYNYNTSIKLTATPDGENAFAQWVDEDGIKVSTTNPYTFNLTGNTTLKAEFSKPTTVYLKPSSAWKEHNAHFAIYAWGKTNSWVEMAAVDCEGDYYKANVPAGFSDFAFVRLRPAGADGYSSTNGGHNWDNKWDQTGNLSVQANGKNMYDIDDKTVSYIHLKPNNNWKSAEARFAAYFFNNTGNKWVNLTLNGDVYTCKKPAGYTSVIFCRMKPGTSNGWGDDQCWNKTKDLTILNDGSNCFSINQDDWGCSGSGDGNANGANGEWFRVLDDSQWKTFTTPTYPLTLKATPYGEYTVKCNGVSHTSSRTKDIVIDLPVGATVEITKAESYDAAYNNNLVIKTSSNSQYEAAKLNNTYTFCGATTIEENFTTTAAHVVYLRVKTTGDPAAWNTPGANYIYCTNRLTNKVVAMTSAESNEIHQESDYGYFKATVPAGYRAFRFERKTASNVAATNTTEYFEHLLPLGQSNCFTIEGKNTLLETFYGDWALGTADGDYRILYVEQQVAHGTGADDWKTVIDTTYQHASDIIKKGNGATIVSLHIGYDKTQHPEVILQKFTGGKWVDVEGQAHMVLGPLTASADMAMLPGRRNTEGDANLRYGDGIEKIKADAEENGKAGRVWNFVVQQSESGASAYINFNTNDFAPYEGNYYIRTDNAAGGWMTYAIPGNVMSHSEYSLEHSDYSHYFCKWVETTAGTPNVKFVVANQYGAAISDTTIADTYTNEEGTLIADANVRWMWNEYTNKGSRAYIAGSKVANFLTATYANTTTVPFEDKGEWVYEKDLEQVKVGDVLNAITANYAGKAPQQLLEETYRENGLVMLESAGDARVSSYTVRIVYDFKINQTICYLIPTGAAVATSIDVLIERTNQDEEGKATQVTAAITPANKEVGLTVYGLITLTKDHITNPAKSEQAALTYWISFPFDVKIGDITGFGEVGKHWMIKYYDGAERAEKGWFLDTKTFWKFFLNTDDVMKANTGYVLTLNKSLLNESNPVYDNTETLRLYFPSMNKITTEINSDLTETSVTLEPLKCNITTPADRTIKDSHWNLIGVPSYANKTITTTNETVKYFYDYSHQNDQYQTAQNIGAKTFKPMHAYMVQFAGVIDWKNQKVEAAQQQLAAKKNADAEEQYTLRLELQQNGTKADQTFVELHDDATTMFDMNVDLTKMFNTGANIYTLIGSDNQVAANVMPIANTTIPVGVQIAKAGEYTFAMPDGTAGITVELIDYETNTRTNLLLSEYTVNLTAGTCENRFALSVKPNNTATSLDNISGETGNEASMKKFIIDGVLYMQKDGVLYDAQGHVVR